MDKALVSPHDIAKKHSMSYQTINYYTNLGLLVVKKRKGNGRLYDDEEVQRCLERIHKMKSQGYSLKLICDIIRKEK